MFSTMKTPGYVYPAQFAITIGAKWQNFYFGFSQSYDIEKKPNWHVLNALLCSLRDTWFHKNLECSQSPIFV